MRAFTLIDAPFMGPEAAEIVTVAPGIFSWQAYDPTVKADLYSTAFETTAGLVVIDPIRLKPAVRKMHRTQDPAAIVVTNENHWRAAARFAAEFSVPIYHRHCAVELSAPEHSTIIKDGSLIGDELTVISIEGAACGEIALYLERDGGTLVVGDALINFEPYGFALLPPKYCSDVKVMGQSLRKLLAVPFERMLFAHGMPLVRDARKRLEALLAEG